MIGSYDGNQYDISIYLEADEVNRLETETIEGVLIKENNPRRQGTISLSVDNTINKDEFIVNLKKDFRIDVSIGANWYQKLINNGYMGTRYDGLGSKLDIEDKSRSTELDFCQMLEFYRDNKERL